MPSPISAFSARRHRFGTRIHGLLGEPRERRKAIDAEPVLLRGSDCRLARGQQDSKRDLDNGVHPQDGGPGLEKEAD